MICCFRNCTCISRRRSWVSMLARMLAQTRQILSETPS